MVVLATVANALAPVLPVFAMTVDQVGSFADRWGLPMALVAFVVITQIGAGLVDRRARARLDEAREERDAAREQRLVAGVAGVERAVTRLTAVTLAMVDAPPEKVAQYLAAFEAESRLCQVCPLQELPEAERAAVVTRIRETALARSKDVHRAR